MRKNIKDFVKTTLGAALGQQLLNEILLTKQLLIKPKKPSENKSIKKPVVINFNANDICNSKCTMCNIWEQKLDYELSADELFKILQDPFFSEVKHVGVTGGEPTLREDLPQLYKAIIKAIPNIEGLSIITNAIKERDVISSIDEVIQICELNGKSFSMMVSLDGYGKTHDTVRGRKGNFETAINVINYFRQKDISVSIGATISKVNVWDIDVLLDFLKKEKLYGRFRVAEFIKRLYNDNRADVIRNFDEDEKYHLILFFYKLIFTYEKDPTIIRTYKSIINILSGGKRLIGCPYHQDGIVLNAKGEIAYCAPKSKLIGNALVDSAGGLYKANIAERDRIITQDCDNCIHDYHAPITYAEKSAELSEKYWKRVISLDQFKLPVDRFIKPVKIGENQIFITGWYGTETVGDKAIIGGIIKEIAAEYSKNISIVISSIYPLITERTIIELGVNAKVVPVYHSDFVAYLKGSDKVVMGGGPLMDLEELSIPLYAFKVAKRNQIKSVVFGCGLGPLTQQRYIRATQEILNLADEIKLRDLASVKLADSWLDKKKVVKHLGDPAIIYLDSIQENLIKGKQTPNTLRCYLREWTHEYAKMYTSDEFLIVKDHFEQSLADTIKNKALSLQVDEIIFDHMHNFAIGFDDRDFSRYFIEKYFSDFVIPVSYNKYLSTIESVANNMIHSKHIICMRFHSVVFASTLKTSFSAIDYTLGGKIFNFLSDNGQLDCLVTINKLLPQVKLSN